MRLLTLFFFVVLLVIIATATCSAQFKKAKQDTASVDDTVRVLIKPLQLEYLNDLQTKIQQLQDEQKKTLLLILGEAVIPESITFQNGVLKAKKKP